ncbi:glycoside hydrolase family 1 protein [Neisseria perflava]|uniref:glycoside hydrolase family 1 protein n=1 Tax=Neisseria perflava TaxID=33053 RepID=UPI0020A20F22|nr:family 1 glycosylhydrolase [Neisseria perflava]MCP1660868.1 beta-glucosidase [Neisseria perflava]
MFGQNGFLWGMSSAAYQVEGHTSDDGRGRCVWDDYLERDYYGGIGVSARVAINFYDRKQYLADLKLMQQAGINSYRFSISWTRIIPDGIGPVNPDGVAHYRRFIEDLIDHGIQPMITLYHWDYPAALAAGGGWLNRDSVKWFARYAEVVFKNFADLCEVFVLINEPTVDMAFREAHEAFVNGEDLGVLNALLCSQSRLAERLKTINHILLACAEAQRIFREGGYAGVCGVAVPFSPVEAVENGSELDIKNAQWVDALLNRWYLDAMYKGQYPQDLLDLLAATGGDAGIQEGDAAAIGAAQFGFLGINYYAPFYIRHDGSGEDYAPTLFDKDGEMTMNGPVRPDCFYNLLMRIKNDYGNPLIYITENGAGFVGEDVLVDGKINDAGRCRYIENHAAALLQARQEGANVQGYHVWSSHDNLEWQRGYEVRFGMIYVDYDTQARIPKQSFYAYKNLITNNRL